MKQIIIRLDLDKNSIPDSTGDSSYEQLKHEVYTYLQDLIDDDNLSFEVTSPDNPEG